MDTITRMRAFVAVVDNEGFSAAARTLGRSKALLSKYVRELEDGMGTLLLNRTTRQFSLTEAGHIYYGRAVELLREFDDLQDLMRESRSGVSGKIRISAPRTFADAEIGKVLVDFAKANPDVVLDIALDDRFVDLVEEGFDLAIRMSKLEDSSLIAKRLSTFCVGVYASPATIEKFGLPNGPEDFQNLPCILDTNARRRDSWPFIDSSGNEKSVQLNGIMSVNSPIAVRNAILADMGFAFCPEFIMRAEVERGSVIRVLPDIMATRSGIYAVYPHRRYLPAKVRAFVDFSADWFKAYDSARSSHTNA